MDWEQLSIIAQIATGLATLAVAIFLVRQIALQRQALDLAHKDSERELLYTSNRLYTDIMGRILDPKFAPIWQKGTCDYDSLTSDEEIRFRMWNQISSINQATNYRAGHEGLDRGIDSRIYEQSKGAWNNWPGLAIYYERFGRSHTYDPDLRILLDRAFEDTQGRKVDKNWVLGVKHEDRRE